MHIAFLAAGLRVLAVFLMIHVLGSQAFMLNISTHERMCESVLIAGSSLVLPLPTM